MLNVVAFLYIEYVINHTDMIHNYCISKWNTIVTYTTLYLKYIFDKQNSHIPVSFYFIVWYYNLENIFLIMQIKHDQYYIVTSTNQLPMPISKRKCPINVW